MRNQSKVIACALTGILAGCGGGDDEGTGLTNASIAQGLWAGSASNGRTATSLVLSDGSYWVLYSGVGAPTTIGGFIQGHSGSSSERLFVTNDLRDFNFEGLGASFGTATVHYLAKQTIQGSVTYSGGTTGTFDGAYNPTYETAPSLGAVVGTYTGQLAFIGAVQAGTLVIGATGAMSGSANGCSASGTISPRTDGNAYDVAVTFGAAPCVYAGQTFNGVAVFDLTTKRLYAAAPSPGRTDGMLFVGVKP